MLKKGIGIRRDKKTATSGPYGRREKAAKKDHIGREVIAGRGAQGGGLQKRH